MSDTLINSRWKSILDDFSSYEGTITSFCKENNISKSQLYYYRKKSERVNGSIFHAISLKEKTEVIVDSRNTNSIRIEIGNAKIFIPANEIAALSSIVKELTVSV